MPYSDPTNKPWAIQIIDELTPNYILDVGAGAGVYGRLIREQIAGFAPNVGSLKTLNAIEIWEPYISRFKLEDIYDEVFRADVREWNDFHYDVVIFGDIFEHMSRDDALKVWTKVREQARAALISIPIIHYPQSEAEGNPYEVHVEDHWTTEQILDIFDGIIDYVEFDVTGVFLAKFKE